MKQITIKIFVNCNFVKDVRGAGHLICCEISEYKWYTAIIYVQCIH